MVVRGHQLHSVESDLAFAVSPTSSPTSGRHRLCVRFSKSLPLKLREPLVLTWISADDLTGTVEGGATGSA